MVPPPSSNYQSSITFKPGELRRSEIEANLNQERKLRMEQEEEQSETEKIKSRMSRL